MISLTMIALVLVAAVPASARSRPSRFEAICYVCRIDPALKEWVSEDGVLHQRGVVLSSVVITEGEPRFTGDWITIANQDVDLATGAVRYWAKGGVVSTSEGVWYTATHAESDGESFSSRGYGYGGDGLEKQIIYWKGTQIAPPFENPPCETDVAMLLSGFIRGR